VATTVSQLLALLKQELPDAGRSDVDPHLRRLIPTALIHLSQERTWFNEADFSFAITSGDREYSSETTGFPKDAARLDDINFLSSGSYRRLTSANQLVDVYPDGQRTTTGTPDRWYWKPPSVTAGVGTLMLWPIPNAAGTLLGRYLRDARRDAASGNLITSSASSDGYTNPWFDEGQEALLGWVLKMFNQLVSANPERATANFLRYKDALAGYKNLRNLHRGSLGQIEPYWSDMRHRTRSW
jgi:hypothetical protein